MEYIVTRKILAEILSVSENYINELGVPKVAYNQYNLVDCVKWYLKYLDDMNKKAIERVKQEKPQDDLARKSAELKQLQIDEARGRLIDKDEVFDAVLTVIQIIIANIDVLAIKASPLLVGLNQKEIQSLLEKEINDIKTKIAKSIENILPADNSADQGNGEEI